jgi:hypothetical protein
MSIVDDVLAGIMMEEEEEASGGTSTLFYDTFTGAGTVALASHTPEIGGPWVIANGAINIGDGHAKYVSERSNAYIATGSTDIYILSSCTRYFGHVIRMIDPLNFYMISSSSTGNFHFIELYKIKNGVAVISNIFGLVTWTDSTLALQKIEIQAFGDTIKAKISDPANPGNFVYGELNDSEFSSGNHGIRTIFAANFGDEVLCRQTTGEDL